MTHRIRKKSTLRRRLNDSATNFEVATKLNNAPNRQLFELYQSSLRQQEEYDDAIHAD